MIILGLDVSLSDTGFCIIELSDKGSISVEKIGSTNTEKEKTRGRKLNLIREQMEYLKKTYKFDSVICERLFHKNHKTTQALYSALGVIQSTFYEHEFVFYSPSTIKLQVAGHGWAKKHEVEASLMNIFSGMRFNNDNESDALGVVITHLKKEGLFNG